MLTYTQSLEGVTPAMLSGFFDRWPNPPSLEAHLRKLESSFARWLALDGENVIGFVTAISDGVIAAYIPLLEVLPEYRGRGIGTALMARMIETLGHLYMTDLLCDEALLPFYQDLGMTCARGAFRRNIERQNCE